MRNGITWILTILGIALAVEPLSAAPKDVIDAIPESAVIVVRNAKPMSFQRQAVRMAKEIYPPLEPMVTLWTSPSALFMNPLFQVQGNARISGINADGPAWVAFFSQEKSAPVRLFAVSTTSAKGAERMKQAVGGNYTFIKQAQTQLYSEDTAIAEQVKECIAGKGASLRGVLDAKSLATFQSGQFSIFISIKRLKELYKEQIDAGRQQMTAGLNAPLPAGSPQPATADAMREITSGFITRLWQVVDDTEGLTLSLRIQPKGIELESFVKMTDDSATDKALQSIAPTPLKNLDKMPDAPVLFGMNGAAMTQFGIGIIPQLLGAGNDARKQEISKIAAEFAKLDLGDSLGSLSVGDLETGALRQSGVIETRSVDKLKELTRSMQKVIAETKMDGIKTEIESKNDAEKFGSRSGDLIVTKQEIDPKKDPLGMRQKMITTMYGPEGLKQRIVYLDGVQLQTVGGGPESMTALVNSFDGGTTRSASDMRGKQPPAQATRKHLLEKSQFLGLVDVARLGISLLALLKKSEQIPPSASEAIDKLVVEPSFLGFAIAAEPKGVRIRFYAPLEQMQGIGKVVNVAQPLIPPTMMPQPGPRALPPQNLPQPQPAPQGGGDEQQ